VTIETAVIRIKNAVVTSNTYLYQTDPAHCLLIDPGLDRDAIEAQLGERHLTPIAIYLTHGHFDHLGSAEHFRARYDIPVYLDPADIKVAGSSNFMMMALKLSSRIQVPKTFTAIDTANGDGAEITRAPGHTAGSVVIRVGDVAFTGDTIYRDGMWLVPWPEEDREHLEHSLRDIWVSLPDHVLVFPGHGGSAMFGSIKRQNRPMRRFLGLEEIPT
jgi:hydroxyacylglutathione hydrolase